MSFIPHLIQDYMSENADFIHRVRYPVQHPLSGHCGFYCILIILMHINKVPILEGIASFPRASLQNDDKCISILSKLFKIFYLEQNNFI